MRPAPVQRERSHVIPALEIVGFEVALNVFDRLVLGSDYKTNLASIRRNLRRRWVVEEDPYLINQFGHPYQGSIYHGFARSAGLGFWESLGYTFAASGLWEIAGEKTPPSWNDQIASGVAGTLLGESFFRVAQLMLERGAPDPAAGRERFTAIVAPTTGFNRTIFGRRFDQVMSSRGAVYYRRMQLGFSTETENRLGTSQDVSRSEGIVDVSMEYGLPGPTGYVYSRPFDYFVLQATGSSANGFESILTRGVLTGRAYELGDRYRGVWGLYGSYDYIAPQLFRVSSTAVSLGTTAQWWLSRRIALQGSALGGAGFAAVGTNRGPRDGDYQYGIAPQALFVLRVIGGDRASIDLTAREYYVSDVAGATTGGHDHIARREAAFTLRLYRQNALAVKYLWSRRDAFYPDLGDRRQIRGTVGVFLTFLGSGRFGATEWREPDR
ncbi:MAG: DUF3943 domain-containing protein [Gemmatimonadaceae bacterium]